MPQIFFEWGFISWFDLVATLAMCSIGYGLAVICIVEEIKAYRRRKNKKAS